MKKLFSVIALSGLLLACNSDKKEEKKTEETSTVPVTDPAAGDAVTTTTSSSDVPNFSDPEVQQFALDYYAFIREYKSGMTDPAKMEALNKTMQDWSTREKAIAMKLANNPAEAQKWATWWLAALKDFYPASTPK